MACLVFTETLRYVQQFTLAAYDQDARRIIGRKSGELPEILGYRDDPELIPATTWCCTGRVEESDVGLAGEFSDEC